MLRQGSLHNLHNLAKWPLETGFDQVSEPKWSKDYEIWKNRSRDL